MDRKTKWTLLIVLILLLTVTVVSTEATLQKITSISSGGSIGSVTSGLPRLYVDGAHIVNEYGQIVVLRGVNVVGFDWEAWKIHWTNLNHYLNDVTKYTKMADYGFNTARLAHIKYSFWMAPTLNERETYRSLFDRNIQSAAENGIYVILDWGQWDSTDGSRVAGMPVDKDQWIAMWKDIVTRYAIQQKRTNVIYEIHNEPHFEDRTSVDDDSTWWTWAQDCINAIRSLGGEAQYVPILVPLHDYATDATKGPLKDGLLQGGNIFYDVHYYWYHYDSNNGAKPDAPSDYSTVYNWFANKTSLNYRGHSIYTLAQLAPVLIGEFGCRGFGPDYANDKTWLLNMLKIVDGKDEAGNPVPNMPIFHFTYFAWWNEDSFPMFQSGSWTQLTWAGQQVVNSLST